MPGRYRGADRDPVYERTLSPRDRWAFPYGYYGYGGYGYGVGTAQDGVRAPETSDAQFGGVAGPADGAGAAEGTAGASDGGAGGDGGL